MNGDTEKPFQGSGSTIKLSFVCSGGEGGRKRKEGRDRGEGQGERCTRQTPTTKPTRLHAGDWGFWARSSRCLGQGFSGGQRP